MERLSSAVLQLQLFRFGSLSTHFPNARMPMPLGSREIRQNADAVDEDTEVEWDYDRIGPDVWSSHGYPVCSGDQESVSQSPVDIITKDALSNRDNELSIKFRSISAGGVSVGNDGHAIAVTGLAGSIVFEKQEYDLKKLHIRRGEHRLDSRVFPVELQFELEDAASEVMILAVLFELGARNQWLDALQVSKWSSLTPDSKAVVTTQPFNALWLLPKEGVSKSNYFSYDGSLTTPPCAQRVTWVVLDQINSLATAQLDSMFPKSFGARNFRPVQPLNGRVVSRLSKVAVAAEKTLAEKVAAAATRRAQGDDAERDWDYSFPKGPLKWGRFSCFAYFFVCSFSSPCSLRARTF
jgi:carbonic anhydrase